MGRDQRGSQGERKRPELGKGLQRWRGGTVREKFGRPKASVAGGVGDMEYCPVSLPCGYGTITKSEWGRSRFVNPVLSPVWDTHGGVQEGVQEAPGRGESGRKKDGAWLGVMSQASCFCRLGCGVPPCSPMPRSPEECRRLRTCSECLARHPRTLQPGDGEVSGVRWGLGTTALFSCEWVGGAGPGGVLGALRTPQSLSSPPGICTPL